MLGEWELPEGLNVLGRVPFIEHDSQSPAEMGGEHRNKKWKWAVISSLVLSILVSLRRRCLPVLGEAIVYESHFGLQRKPFAMTPDPSFLFQTPTSSRGPRGITVWRSGREGFHRDHRAMPAPERQRCSAACCEGFRVTKLLSVWW